MRKPCLLVVSIFYSLFSFAQTPKTYTSSEILQQVKKLNVLGSVLYIAAHPDDENTRLLAYLANEKLYRTGYLSLTRGDGGQNLIGDEQGIDLGLIRTQELLSARRIDGAEQFFSRAYDFGFCKTPEEALKTWGHDKILSDVVWVIRKFRPDVIIARFPEDSRAGHGHHAASGILAREAFDAAADATKFPEQLKQGVTVWQAKRMLWNTFNFGNTNTTSEDQFKMDVGMYNPLLGKSYGEMAALSRSQHKSQGFGVPAQRGESLEYFSTIKGDKPVNDLMEGVVADWKRTEKDNAIQSTVDSIYKNYSAEHPENSVAQLVRLYKKVETIKDAYWKEQKQNEITKLLEYCSGLFMEATAGSQYAVQGDSLKITTTMNNRLGIPLENTNVNMYDIYHDFDGLKKNSNASFGMSVYIRPDQKISQPYWLENKMEKGSFNVSDQQLIGRAENEPLSILFGATIQGIDFKFKKPIRYKYTDPVKGEIYQPVSIIPPFSVRYEKDFSINKDRSSFEATIQSYKDSNKIQIDRLSIDGTDVGSIAKLTLNKNQIEKIRLGDADIGPVHYKVNGEPDWGDKGFFKIDMNYALAGGRHFKDIRSISYDHIPSINYFKEPSYYVLDFDLKIKGSLVGYIAGAGDKVPQALEQMGYKVVLLKQADLNVANLKQFDAIVTGVRAYNINEWLSNSYDALMQYVKDGGVLLTQYNTNNSIGPVKAKISPYPFTISRNRVTDEEATVNFLVPDHPVLSYPNKITQKDFDGWVQERSIYNAENIDPAYQRIFSMKDPNENEQDGSLIIANYGKGRFVYTGLVFFRELPAGVPGAYRLFANLIAKTN